LFEARIWDFLKSSLNGITVVKEHEADTCRKVLECICKVAQLFLLVDKAIPDTSGDQKGSLVKISRSQSYSQGGILLEIFGLDVDIFIQEVQN